MNHEENYQEEHELPCEYVEEEHFDETHLVKDLIHEEAPHDEEALVFSPPFDEVIQVSIPRTVIANFSSSHATFLDGLSISLCRLEVPFFTFQS